VAPVSLRLTVRTVLIALTCLGLLGAPAQAAQPPAAEEPEPPVGFKLQGSHGYSIVGEAFLEQGLPHAFLTLTVTRGNEFASYQAPAQVTADSIHADLGSLGRVDLALRRSGLVKPLKVPCFGHRETFEPGIWEGVIEFDGEGGYTRARATRTAALPYLALLGGSRICRGQSSGESRSANLPGARLAGISYANGRILKFKFNKNRPGGKTLFNASLAERRDGIRIFRELSGVAPAGAFRYGPLLRTATLSPPAPFSGSARLTRQPNGVSPLIAGDLTLAFPGHRVGLDGPEVHVSLVHARLRKGDHGSISIGI
jgi:hypothetical protein